MSKFNIFSIFAHKTQRGLQSLISTQDKIEEIQHQYNKKSEKYIKSATAMLANAKTLKKKFEELDGQTTAAKRGYEQLISQNNLEDAKVKFIMYKGLKSARDAIEEAWNKTEAQCVKVRDTLKTIDTNRALMQAKLTALSVQIDTLKLVGNNEIGDFGIDCEEMIAEVEQEVQNTQFKLEAKQEVHDIMHSRKTMNTSNSAIDAEFAEIVRQARS